MNDRYCAADEYWLCAACGKTSEFDCYGIEGKHSYGWDESCMLNAFKAKRSPSDATTPIQVGAMPQKREGDAG